MAIISDKQDCITAIVTFKCEPEQQNDLADKVRAYIKDFISQQDGLGIVNIKGLLRVDSQTDPVK